MPRVLFGVSSIGLGHAKRSLSVARELERLNGKAQTVFLCASPALDYLKAAGARVAPESQSLASLSQAFEAHSSGGWLNPLAAVREAYSLARRNYALIAHLLEGFDLLVQDEFLETLLAHRWDRSPRLPEKRAAITDFVDIGVGGLNPIALAASWYAERIFRRALLLNPLCIFAETLEAVPKRLRRWVKQNFLVTGPIVQVDLGRAEEIRRNILASSGKTRILCFTIGGTAIGKHILDLAWENRALLSQAFDAKLLFITGPRVDPQTYLGDERVLAVGLTADAASYFAASDCVVTQAGASTLNELAALGKPTVCVPIAGHWEQERNAERFKGRPGYRVLRPSELSPTTLANAIGEVLGVPATPSFRVGGATLAAKAILELLEGKA